MNLQDLFIKLYTAKTEQEIDAILQSNSIFQNPSNWYKIGKTESNFSIIENQQSNPIAALVEKVTNSIDATLMRKCIETGIDAKSTVAPRSMDEAIKLFYPNYKNWDLSSHRRKQAEEIQIIADGPTRDTSVIVYDNGEGQHPEDFENTFLSLMQGNKNEIQFVQGKYNMGGSGAIVFCGKKGYQLIASKRYTNDGLFGFTITREHPLTEIESQTKKNTWYEYFKLEEKIPSFEITDLDLNLHNRMFKTGTIIKMYSYQFPSGYSGFAQDLNQSLNEFLFDPVLPILTVDKKERYPNNKVLQQDLYGLKRRLEEEKKYVEEYFTEAFSDSNFGEMAVTCYVFRAKQEGKTVKETKDDIKRRYFKNNMTVLFCMNGQVHGHLTTEFITRTLKFNLLKDYLLIHVDCTKMKYEFRKELFMASRDRLKVGDETNSLRSFLGKTLQKSQLDEINRRRKESIGLESEDTNELIKSFAKNLPKDSDLFKLLQNTLKLEEKKTLPQQILDKKSTKKENQQPFTPQRFPTKFKFSKSKEDQISVITIPQGGEKILKFETDVENHYFDRSEAPGDLKISILKIKNNETSGGTAPGTAKELGEIFNITRSGPNDGKIKLSISPSDDLQVGSEVQIEVSLSSAGETFEEIVWVKIATPEAPQQKTEEEEKDEIGNIGLPELVKITQSQWDQLETKGIEMDYSSVLALQASGDTLEKIYINLDSHVYLNHRKKLKSENQIETSQKKYLSSVYFHTMFLYMITKRKGFRIQQGKNDEEKNIEDYIKEVFDSYYSDFLLNFGMEQLMGALED